MKSVVTYIIVLSERRLYVNVGVRVKKQLRVLCKERVYVNGEVTVMSVL